MSLIRYRPEERLTAWERLGRMADEMARSWGEEPTELGTWAPSVNIYEKNGDIMVEAELPGVKKDDIVIRVENGVMTLKGERKEQYEVKKENFYRQERFTGTFMRSFQLPSNVVPDKIDATFKDGVLFLKVPRLEEAKPKQVPIH